MNDTSVLETALRAFLVDVIRQVVREEVQLAKQEAALAPVEPPAHDAYLTTADAARLVSVTEPTIRRWVASGDLKAYRAGRQYRIRLSELHQTIERTTNPAPQNRVDRGKEVDRLVADILDSEKRRCAGCNHLPKLHAYGSGRCHVRACACERFVSKQGARP